MHDDIKRILQEATAPGYSNVYVIASEGKARINVAAQQCRSLNLAWALASWHGAARASADKGGGELAGKRVLVFGAGAGGLTCAAALKLAGATVEVYDRALEPMHLQQGCHHRFLHPSLVDWPAEHSTMGSANLPILNWSVGTADEVRRQILREYRKTTREEWKHEVISDFKLSTDGEVEVLFCSGNSRKDRPDFVVVALGFGVERTLSSLPRLSYWRVDALDQPTVNTLDSPQRILVHGSGDGGAIDFLRASLDGFDHGPFLDHVCHLLDQAFDGVRPRALVADIERDAKRRVERLSGGPSRKQDYRAENQVARELQESYQGHEPCFKRVDEFLKKQLRPNKDVTWSGLTPTVMRYRTQPLHRLLAWRITRLEHDRFRYWHGDLKEVALLDQTQRSGFLYQVQWVEPDSGRPIHTDAYHAVFYRAGGEGAMPTALQSAIDRRPTAARELDTERLRAEAAAYFAQMRPPKKAPVVAPAGACPFAIDDAQPVDDLVGDEVHGLSALEKLACYKLRLHVKPGLVDSAEEVVDYVLHSSEDGIIRRAVRGFDPDKPFPISVFTWDDYAVEVRLRDGKPVGTGLLTDGLDGDSPQAKQDLQTGRELVKQPQTRWILAQRAHRERNGARLKEHNLERGLVQSLFKPCAEALIGFAFPAGGPVPSKVLDVGCGSAIVARALAGRFNDCIVHGFDASPEAIEIAQQACEKLPKVHVWVDDAIFPEFARGPYDAIVAQHLLQNLSADDRVRALKSLRELLRPGGSLVVGVWRQSSVQDRRTAYEAIYTASGEAAKLNTLGMADAELRRLLDAAGFKVDDIKQSQEAVEKNLRHLVREYMEGSKTWLDKGYVARCDQLSKVEDRALELDLGTWLARATKPR